MERYVCPNGHPVEFAQMLPCNAEGCMAYVTWEPVAHGMALARQLEGAVAALRDLATEVEFACGPAAEQRRPLRQALDRAHTVTGGR